MKVFLLCSINVTLFASLEIHSNPNEVIKISQIQPSSLDLSLSEECYEVKNSFLDKEADLTIKKRDNTLNNELLDELI